MEIRRLRASDDRSGLRSGDADLDRFFWSFAGQNQFRLRVGTTYVAVDGEQMLGYATVAPGQIQIENLPVAARRGLPRYPLPVLRLARLGVDSRVQGRGVGAQLLKFVLHLCTRMAEDFGCIGVLVDAKPDARGFYSKYGFIALEALEGEADARPRPTPMFLSLREIEGSR